MVQRGARPRYFSDNKLQVIGALISTTGFWGILCYNNKKESPQKERYIGSFLGFGPDSTGFSLSFRAQTLTSNPSCKALCQITSPSAGQKTLGAKRSVPEDYYKSLGNSNRACDSIVLIWYTASFLIQGCCRHHGDRMRSIESPSSRILWQVNQTSNHNPKTLNPKA